MSALSIATVAGPVWTSDRWQVLCFVAPSCHKGLVDEVVRIGPIRSDVDMRQLHLSHTTAMSEGCTPPKHEAAGGQRGLLLLVA